VASIGENGIGDDDYCNLPSLAFCVIRCPRAAACSLTRDCLRSQSSSLALTDLKLLRAIQALEEHLRLAVNIFGSHLFTD
jgi:hypothetical protein